MRVGEKRVKGINGGDQTKGPYTSEITWSTSTSGPSKRKGYTDESGMETVEAWDCHISCPVRVMDEQSGMSRDGVAGPKSRPYGNGEIYGTAKEFKPNGTEGYGGQGGASRFFPIFSYTEEDFLT